MVVASIDTAGTLDFGSVRSGGPVHLTVTFGERRQRPRALSSDVK